MKIKTTLTHLPSLNRPFERVLRAATYDADPCDGCAEDLTSAVAERHMHEGSLNGLCDDCNDLWAILDDPKDSKALDGLLAPSEYTADELASVKNTERAIGGACALLEKGREEA